MKSYSWVMNDTQARGKTHHLQLSTSSFRKQAVIPQALTEKLRSVELK
jgi:hypothetical protein